MLDSIGPVESKLVAEIEFLEWTDADWLRHSRFVALREDKDPEVVRQLIGSPRNVSVSFSRQC
jgi:ATP-dependent DNA ligase